MLNIFQTLSSSLLLGIIGALLASHLALKRFQSERWWDRKLEAYQRVIEALHYSKAFSDTHLDAEIEMREVSEEHDEQLRQRSQEAASEIEKAADKGALIMSKEAVKCLNEYRRQAKKGQEKKQWFEYLDADLAAVSNCLSDFIKIAKCDFGKK